MKILSRTGWALFSLWLICANVASAEVKATHVYHNHMPNFWTYFDVANFERLPVGTPIRYAYDAQVIQLKKNPPAGWPILLNGSPMPHDPLLEGGGYYQHHAKWGAYQYWPWQAVEESYSRFPQSQTHVTMSAAVVNNVHSLNLANFPEFAGKYSNPAWAAPWRDTYKARFTPSGARKLDVINFTGHHSMGPLVGSDYFLKELIYHRATMAQSYFLGDAFAPSKGFFPTELGFSERLIPVLAKLGITWSVAPNVQFSRTLKDYPYLNDPGVDTLISPPNRADLQNQSEIGSWVSLKMPNEQQVTQNKFPFAAVPHWARSIDPVSGAEQRVVVVPVEQASSWEEGYMGSTQATLFSPYAVAAQEQWGRPPFFVIAHDGDNSSGRAGSFDTWQSAYNTTYSAAGVGAMGIDEYLKTYPIPKDDLIHVQDGSWIDTRDSSADPSWYHWHLPFGVWSGQLSKFNEVLGTSYKSRSDFNGKLINHMVSFEYGYHYLERNFALLMAALNYAKTAEQIWLDAHPQHWSPTTERDRKVTHAGNQLNPWMLSYPVKGEPSLDYAGGAAPPELAWYFLLPAMDSGFGYYDENMDDHVKPTLAFNQSLFFSKPYVTARTSSDRTGPSIWWPQRYPYNPGSANNSKAEGWATLYANNQFALYTYIYDVNAVEEVQVKVRIHRDQRIDPKDKAHKVYDPEALAQKGDPEVNHDRVGPWTSYPMKKRVLKADINGVKWQNSTLNTVMQTVPAQEIGDLYYSYFDKYQNQLIDYYIEAKDRLGNITRSEIQHVYVGAGRYRKEGTRYLEDPAGPIAGQSPFFSDKPPVKTMNLFIKPQTTTAVSAVLEFRSPTQTSWSTGGKLVPLSNGYLNGSISFYDAPGGLIVRYREETKAGAVSENLPSTDGLQLASAGTYTIQTEGTVVPGPPSDVPGNAIIYYSGLFKDSVYIHYRPSGGTWTPVPGILMTPSEITGYWKISLDVGQAAEVEAVFNNGSGTWDNNGGNNYRFPVGVSHLGGGQVKGGLP